MATNTISQATKNAITLKGSAAIISEYLNFGINSILFQRGIYPPETFKSTQQYGLTILVSTDERIQGFLKNVLGQCQEWLSCNQLEKISMTIINVHNAEVMECWEFKVQADEDKSDKSGDTKNVSNKELKRIQQEIGSVMRQISATVSFLPLLDCVCSFDILIHTVKDCDVPERWNETKGVTIRNQQVVQLRSFSTGLHKVDTLVNYRFNDD